MPHTPTTRPSRQVPRAPGRVRQSIEARHLGHARQTLFFPEGPRTPGNNPNALTPSAPLQNRLNARHDDITSDLAEVSRHLSFNANL